MTKSRTTALAVLLLVASRAQAAEQVTAEQAIERYRQTFRTIDEIDCPPAKGDEIQVCGKRDSAQRQRLPLPVEEVPGRHIPGEIRPATDAMTLDQDAICFSNKGCPKAGISLIPIVITIVQTIVKAATD